MDISPLVEQFRNRSGDCRTDDDLATLLATTVDALGFDHFAVIHGGDTGDDTAAATRISNYPDQWTRQLIDERLYVDDPVLLAARHAICGFDWGELDCLVEVRRPHQALLAAASEVGLRQGFTVPGNVPFEPSGSCSFVTEDDRPIKPWRRHAAELIGGAALNAARRLRGWTEPVAEINFSKRERQVLQLIAEGKSNGTIAQILGIGLATVKTYVSAAMHKLGVYDRTRAAVLAARGGIVRP